MLLLQVNIMRKVFLQGLNPKQAKEVSQLAMIPVANGTRLVPPSSLYVRLRDDLSPFAFELPAALVGHSTTLQELGMKAAPTAADLIILLQVPSQHITAEGRFAHKHIRAMDAFLLCMPGSWGHLNLCTSAGHCRCLVSGTSGTMCAGLQT